jgi:hypothetical protein
VTLDNTILRLRILEAINSSNIEDMKMILTNALLNTSRHWQERAIQSGLAIEEDFFYDTYMGTNPDLLRMNKHG